MRPLAFWRYWRAYRRLIRQHRRNGWDRPSNETAAYYRRRAAISSGWKEPG